MKLLKFWASWCVSCSNQSKLLENFTDIPVIDCDVEDNPEMADKYGIRSLPTLILLDENDKEIHRFNGFTTLDKIREKL